MPSRARLNTLMRIISGAYFVWLTALLLTERPEKLIGMGSGLPDFLETLIPFAHLLSFSVLAVLGLAARWPVPRWAVALLLIGYGGATELTQGLLPGRTPAGQDWFQDILGVLVGSLLCWAAARSCGGILRMPCDDRGIDPAEGDDATGIFRRSATKHTAAGQSWWN